MENKKRLNTWFIAPDGKWNHLVITSDGEKEKYYCNGVLTGEFETKKLYQLDDKLDVGDIGKNFVTLKDRYDFVGDGGIKATPINYAGEVGINGGTYCGGPGSRVKFVGVNDETIEIPEEIRKIAKEYNKKIEGNIIKNEPMVTPEDIQKWYEKYFKENNIENKEVKQGDVRGMSLLQELLIGLFAEVKSNEKLASSVMDKTMLLGGQQFVSGPETYEEQPFVSYLDSLEHLKNKIHSNNIMLENILNQITQIL